MCLLILEREVRRIIYKMEMACRKASGKESPPSKTRFTSVQKEGTSVVTFPPNDDGLRLKKKTEITRKNVTWIYCQVLFQTQGWRDAATVA